MECPKYRVVQEALKIRAVEGLSYAAALRKSVDTLNAAEAKSTREAETAPATPHQDPTVAQEPLPARPLLRMETAGAGNLTDEFLRNAQTTPRRPLLNPHVKQPQLQSEAEKAIDAKLSQFMVALLTTLDDTGGMSKLGQTIAAAGSTLLFDRRVVFGKTISTDTMRHRVNSM